MTATATNSALALSVVVVALGRGAHLVRCLETLRKQTGIKDGEIIVPHDDQLGEMEKLRGQFPEVRFVRHPVRRPGESGRHTYAELRAAGVGAARGSVVAVTEDQCIPPADWCANVLAAHKALHAAIGGPVEKQEPDTALNWAIYLRELGGFMPPMREGPSAALTDCNVTYKRAALEAIAPVWAESFHEPQVHAALAARGETLWLCPRLVTYQQRTLKFFPALVERYEFGRLYGSLRVAGVGPGKRLLMWAASAILPVLLLARVVLAVLGKRRHILPCFRALPFLVVFATVWAWGESLGYLTGRPPAAWDREQNQ